MLKKSGEPTILIDSRERIPYKFKGSVTKALPTGDYSVQGLETKISVERKTKEDLYGCLGQGRKRFEREMERLGKFHYAAVVVECNLPDFLKAPHHSQMNPKAAINSIIALGVKNRVCIHFAGDRRHARSLTKQLLLKFHKYFQNS